MEPHGDSVVCKTCPAGQISKKQKRHEAQKPNPGHNRVKIWMKHREPILPSVHDTESILAARGKNVKGNSEKLCRLCEKMRLRANPVDKAKNKC